MALSVTGRERLARKLRALPEIAERRIRAAMEAAADDVVMMMKRLAPVDDGDLQMSISWTWGDAPKGAIKIGSVGRTRRGGGPRITIFAGNAEAFYARWIEFGTAPHLNGGRFAGTRNPGTRAQPFFYVSFRANRRRMKSTISRAITRAAKEVAAQG